MMSFPFPDSFFKKESSYSLTVEDGIQALHRESWKDALVIFEELLAQEPPQGRLYMYAAIAASSLDQKVLARDYIEKALSYDKRDPQIYYNQGIILGKQEDFLGALEAYSRAIALNPFFADAYNNMGFIFWSLGRHQESFEYLTRAIGLNPHHDKAHYSRAEILLLWGDLELGFKEYEWRWKHELMPQRLFEAPLWQGEPLQGKSIFLYDVENFGHGDLIQFCRYALLLKEQQAFVSMECSPETFSLFQETPFIDQVIVRGREAPPPHAYRIPFLSLPCVFHTTLQSIPFPQGYLFSRGEIPLPPHPRLSSPKQRIGLVWAGNPGHLNDSIRSLPSLSTLAPLFHHTDIAFYSLQLGEARHQIQSEGFSDYIQDLSPLLTDFKQTASFIQNLDLIITVDTAVAHLAGALGKKVWILLPHIPEWRWLLNCIDSPWYKSARLFRQKKVGEWEGPVQQICSLVSRHTTCHFTG